MGAKIDTIDCTFLKTKVPRLKKRVEVYQRPAVSGYGSQQLGDGGGEFNILAIKRDTKAVVDQWGEDIETLQGSVVDIIDDWGDTHEAILLHRVSVLIKTRIIVPDVADQVRGVLRIQAVKTKNPAP